MSRRFAILIATAALGLTVAACDDPNSGVVAASKTGECLSVSGKDALGRNKLIKGCSANPTAGQSTLPPAGDQSAAAANQAAAAAEAAKAADATKAAGDSKTADATTPAAKPAVCQPVAPACVTPGSGSNPVASVHALRGKTYGLRSASYGHSTVRHGRTARTHWRRVTHKVTHHRHGHVVTEVVTEYVPESGVVPLDSPGGLPLAGGPDVYERDRRSYSERTFVPPPPPPPPVAVVPPPPAVHYDRREYDSRSSSSYSSRSYENHSAVVVAPPPPPVRKPCNCAPRPHYEPDGYLTWPGKPQVY